jgi:hypothetical protein
MKIFDTVFDGHRLGFTRDCECTCPQALGLNALGFVWDRSKTTRSEEVEVSDGGWC